MMSWPAVSCQSLVIAVCAFQSASSKTRPCWCNTPAKFCLRSLGQFEKSPLITPSSGDGYQQRPSANRHELAKTNLKIAPFVCFFQQEAERTHLVSIRPLLANADIGVACQLAVGWVAKNLA